ncbi:MAG: tail fiber domain-containing protein, partial [Candidatus Bathyarchaeia archaeon]|jgi:hypothetical protein
LAGLAVGEHLNPNSAIHVGSGPDAGAGDIYTYFDIVKSGFLIISDGAAGDYIAVLRNGTTDAQPALYLPHGPGVSNGGWFTASDIRFKQNIQPLQNSLQKILALQGISFAWKDKPQRSELGLIAQDVKQIVPEAVMAFKENGVEDYHAVNYASLVPLLVEAIKELKAEVDELKKLKGNSA